MGIQFLVNAYLVPSLNPQAVTLWRFDHITQTTCSPCDAAVRHRSAIAISDCLAMLSQFLSCDHDWHRALGDKVIRETAQQYAFDCTSPARANNDQSGRQKINKLGDHVARRFAMEDFYDNPDLQACLA